jgi:hypothetical protein
MLRFESVWYQFTQWLDYYGKVWDKAVVAVSPNSRVQSRYNLYLDSKLSF